MSLNANKLQQSLTSKSVIPKKNTVRNCFIQKNLQNITNRIMDPKIF